ncbi:MAG: S-layer homology domain-containing protein, partial [Clostridiales bacterium]
MKKRFLALLLALVMVFSFSFAAFAAEPNQDSSNVSAKTFPDMPNDWSTEALNAAINNGLMQGTDKGKLEPQSNLKRVEMAIMINRAFNATESGSLEGFTDVNTGHWFYAELQKSIQMKTFMGDENCKLNPECFITRQDAFLVLARALDVKPVTLTQAEENALFNDAQSIDFWAKGEVLALAKAKLIKGYNGKVNPQDNITRA